MARRRFIPLVEAPRRARRVIAARGKATIATYTMAATYAGLFEPTAGVEIIGGYLLMQPQGTVVALEPVGGLLIPNTATTYPWATPLGVLNTDLYFDWATHVEAPVILRGDVVEGECWDNAIYGTVLAATKAALGDRIKFVSKEI